MSAWIVSREHIDVLVTALGHHEYPDTCFTQEMGDAIGRALWRENLKSVSYRYPEDKSGERPGPADFTDEQIDAYTWTRRDVPTSWFNSAARCYDYQSCEHPEYGESNAKRKVEEIVEAFPASDAEFEKAPWGIDARHFEEAKV